jgi:hypothetical protein
LNLCIENFFSRLQVSTLACMLNPLGQVTYSEPLSYALP